MLKFSYLKFCLIFILVFVLDQLSKYIFLQGFVYKGEFFDLILTYNTGVAFSMFAFLGEYLKYIQLIFIIILFFYLFYQKEFLKTHIIAFAMMLSAGCSNLLDRFMHIGVVDFVFWHKWFEFAVFNFADVMINISVALILIKEIFNKGKKC
ncbi:signal peptidase II [Campylobacter insulaenigrae]|uniref:Lipoprotein signal peptidase n=1 Tax=Campylobacter insulaenigrae NCTC 12927 TaxID=1031564 RepID=A0A0A8H2U1_9BACT|nr:signal peptidase II [Campylobacter insulaenigrae]AJC88438.1 prolipoprotein signal peptidase II [Campylobacter insulaenigrae NCTC 12927]MCR6570535.1 signal peptidase II [Campylobacter insulaenigrae]MCR6572341.1 signal peptidase II [Campylobacter insulaenigrae]MCR6581710.1 signal peptidase II [Campylobacter insulaenigrae]MCR6582992.1 signal peptidase II [Campylobacter insulaenigrae]